MKTLLLFGLFLVCALNTVYAQEEIKETKEIKVKDHVYRVIYSEAESGRKYTWIEKATDSLRYTKPGYKWREFIETDYDDASLRQLVKKYIAPAVESSVLESHDYILFFINTIFDMDGNIREMALRFTSNLNIPMDVVDDFFTAVMSSGIKCTYKKNHPGLKNARFLDFNSGFDLRELQE